MSEACHQTPFWQRQPRLPLEVYRFLQDRLEAALQEPATRQVLVWPTVLGAPRLRERYPEGLPEPLLLDRAARMLGALGQQHPAAAWWAHRAVWTDTAEAGPTGWRPGGAWGAFGPLVSLRCGWRLAALTPLPLGERYGLASAVSLFNHGLFHECHVALEPLWTRAAGELKTRFQGLILLAAGYHHLQQHNRQGMLAVWEEALEQLGTDGGTIATPWGEVRAQVALDLTARRLDHGRRSTADAEADAGDDASHDAIWGPLWALDRPTWELA